MIVCLTARRHHQWFALMPSDYANTYYLSTQNKVSLIHDGLEGFNAEER